MSTITSVDLCRSSCRLFVKHPEVFQHFSSATLKCQQGFRTNHELLSLTVGQRNVFSRQPCRNKIVCHSSPLPGAPGPSHSWKGWMIGIVLSVILPFWRHKWTPLLAIKKEVDMIVDTVEAVVEVVEQVAEKVEEVADDIGDHLPDGKLKDALEAVESIAKEAAKDAHLADQLIEKAEEVEDRVEDFFESAVDQAGNEITKDVGDEQNIVQVEKKIQ
ncbi:uncharacterized protein Pyn_16711 [Prunus yedoensis var. nudiflora]|uniref:Uncharacterized protein n=1 Tax=Prunus yedoensis var. nudiflora TaxID=2094558 RepID=A0A314ZCW1_PRUYE|nr:uncharacterized protein Pyn_16711 [Prunus yedoensis var. nudiflora]